MFLSLVVGVGDGILVLCYLDLTDFSEISDLDEISDLCEICLTFDGLLQPFSFEIYLIFL